MMLLSFGQRLLVGKYFVFILIWRQRRVSMRDVTAEAWFIVRQPKADPNYKTVPRMARWKFARRATKKCGGKAIHYRNNEWGKLIWYLEDGRYLMNNNLAENAIRPFVELAI